MKISETYARIGNVLEKLEQLGFNVSEFQATTLFSNRINGNVTIKFNYNTWNKSILISSKTDGSMSYCENWEDIFMKKIHKILDNLESKK